MSSENLGRARGSFSASIARSAPMLTLLASAALLGAREASAQAEDFVARARAAYSALTSYSDSATIETELGFPGAPAIRERHTFTSRFRRPRHFYFEFNEDESAGGDRFVIWSDDEAFRTWWATTGVEETYLPGRGVAALVAAIAITNGAAAIVTPLLFPQANLKGALLDFESEAYEALETVGARSCHRIRGVQRSVYSDTGGGEQLRATTLWLDAETFLLCKMFEDTPRGLLAGSVDRRTTVFSGQPDPELDDQAFVFEPPAD